MPGTVLIFTCVNSFNSFNNPVKYVQLILQMRTLGQREVKEPIPGHSASKW